MRVVPSPVAPTRADDVAPIRAYLLGPARIAVGDRVLGDDAWPRRSARTLLLLLLSTPDHRLPRERVLETLWPEADPAASLNALYTSLHALRRAFEPDLRAGRGSAYVEVRGGNVGLRAMPGLFVDTDAFRAAVARAETGEEGERTTALREVVALHGGDFLADEPYADWPVATRERMRRDWRRAVLDLADIERAAGRPLAALRALEAVLGADPTDEAAHRALMQALLAAGRRDEALRQYDRCVDALREELDVEPSEETDALAAAIGSSPPPPAVVTPRTAIRPAPIPVPPTRIIGRDADLDALDALLADPDVRLVTLTGPGGIGKTRLALEAARRAPQTADGTGFVSLGTVRDRSLVIPTIARALGIEEAAGRSADEQLRDALYGREPLLVLDNFEQVVEAATDVAALLEGAPGLRLVVTSREPLHVRAERIHIVPPIAVPAAERDGLARPLTADDVAAYAGVSLFVERVGAVRPGFRLDDSNATAIAAVCARLDGLPLAIELAAARCRHLEPVELLGRLDHRLPALTGGARDLPARLRTMHDAIAWSYDLLDDAEQRLFRRLCAFVGGCTPDMAEALHAACDGASTDPARRATLDVIESLADKSLIRLDLGEATRIEMLETIREFGLVKLGETGEDGVVRGAHAALFLEWAERAATELTGPEQAPWLERLEREHDNLRAAFETLTATDAAPDGALRLCRSLFRFWRAHGHHTEGRAKLERALARPGSRNVARARALASGGDLAETQGDYVAAEEMYREALAISGAHDDAAGIAEAAYGMAAIAIDRSDLTATAEWADRALATYRDVGDRRGAAASLNYLAAVAFHRGELDRAAELWQECVSALAEAGDERSRSIGLSNLGALELVRGRPERAIEHHREAVAIARRLGDTWAATGPLINLGRTLISLGRTGEAQPLLEEAHGYCGQLGDPVQGSAALQVLGMASLAEGRPADAAAFLAESLALAQSVGERILAATTLELAACVAAALGEPAAAARNFGAVEALREEMGALRESVDEPAYLRGVDAARAALGPTRFAEAWAGGRGLSFDVVAGEALAALRDVKGF